MKKQSLVLPLTLTRLRRIDRRPFLGLLGLGLSGCGGLLPIPDSPTLYTLSPKSTFPDDLPIADWQLLIETPFAAAVLDTVRVAVLTEFTSVDYFAGVSWTDLAPEMIQTLIIESFENSRKIVAVGRETVGLRADYILSTELREFQFEQRAGQPSQVRVTINAKLIQEVRRSIVANENFEYVEVVQSPDFDAIIEGFDEALGKVMRRLVIWTLVEGNAAWNG